MKIVLLMVLLSASAVLGAPRRRREAYVLPDGAELLVGSLKTTFKCAEDGYFADVDNDCKIFHVCHNTEEEGTYAQHFSFLCGNQTIFNQLSFTCAHPEEAVPCESAKNFFYLNENIGDPKVEFLSDNDLEQAAPLIPAFGQRVLEGAASVVKAAAKVAPKTQPRTAPRAAASESLEVKVEAPNSEDE